MENKLVEEILASVPMWFWALIGAVIVLNLSSILTFMTFIFKAGQFVSNTNNGIKDAKDAAVRAHKRIDVTEEKIEKLDDRLDQMTIQ